MQRLAFDRNSRRLFFTDSLEGAVYAIDTTADDSVRTRQTVAEGLQQPIAIAVDNITGYADQSPFNYSYLSVEFITTK